MPALVIAEHESEPFCEGKAQVVHVYIRMHAYAGIRSKVFTQRWHRAFYGHLRLKVFAHFRHAGRTLEDTDPSKLGAVTGTVERK